MTGPHEEIFVSGNEPYNAPRECKICGAHVGQFRKRLHFDWHVKHGDVEAQGEPT